MSARDRLLTAIQHMDESEAAACLERLGLNGAHERGTRSSFRDLLRLTPAERERILSEMRFEVDTADLSALEAADV